MSHARIMQPCNSYRNIEGKAVTLSVRSFEIIGSGMHLCYQTQKKQVPNSYLGVKSFASKLTIVIRKCSAFCQCINSNNAYIIIKYSVLYMLEEN